MPLIESFSSTNYQGDEELVNLSVLEQYLQISSLISCSSLAFGDCPYAFYHRGKTIYFIGPTFRPVLSRDLVLSENSSFLLKQVFDLPLKYIIV
jgi:hypothetical protein